MENSQQLFKGAKKGIAFIICSNVIGGHEFQSRALVDDFAKYVKVSVFLNNENQLPLFAKVPGTIKKEYGLFFQNGWIGMQILRGLFSAKKIQKVLKDYDHVIICAGAIEAGISCSIALHHKKNLDLYLPFFYDRKVIWGRVGLIYNFILSLFGRLYNRVITINRIQAKLLYAYLRKQISIIPNLINEVPQAQKRLPGRLLFIGRLDYQKRLLELLDWLNFPNNPFKEMLIIGDGPEREDVVKKAAEINNLKVSLLGWKSIDEQTMLIDGNDVLVLNSVIEGEPLIIREANRRGIVVIARNIYGVRCVTSKRNRFDSKESLRQAVTEAGLGLLEIKSEKNNQEVYRARQRATKLFLIKKH